MRTFILFIVFISFAISPLLGQYPPADRKEAMKQRTAQMADSLQLDSLQKLLFINAYDQYFTQRFKLREKYVDDRERIRDESQKLNELRDSSIRAILTEDQWIRYEAMIQKMMQRKNPRRGG